MCVCVCVRVYGQELSLAKTEEDKSEEPGQLGRSKNLDR